MSAPKRKAMGKGLSALLNDANSIQSAKEKNADQIVGTTAEVNIENVHPNPNQPRTQFDKEALQELSISIKELGIIQPITVRSSGSGQYQIISGERRYRAAKLAGLEAVPVFIRLADDQTMLEMALVENIQREELDAIEIALSYQRLIEECELTQEAMSERVGKKRSTITNYLRLLKLQPILQAGLRDKMITMGHARAIINVADEDDQLSIYEDIIANDLSVRQVEDLVRRLRERDENADGEIPKAKPKAAALPEQHTEFKEELHDKLGSKIAITRSSKGNGKITISFKNDKEFDRIVNLLKN